MVPIEGVVAGSAIGDQSRQRPFFEGTFMIRFDCVRVVIGHESSLGTGRRDVMRPFWFFIAKLNVYFPPTVPLLNDDNSLVYFT